MYTNFEIEYLTVLRTPFSLMGHSAVVSDSQDELSTGPREVDRDSGESGESSRRARDRRIAKPGPTARKLEGRLGAPALPDPPRRANWRGRTDRPWTMIDAS